MDNVLSVYVNADVEVQLLLSTTSIAIALS